MSKVSKQTNDGNGGAENGDKQKKKKQPPKAPKGEVRFDSYVSKISKRVAGADGKGKVSLTMSSQALREVALLIEHAINNITHNTESILKYNESETIDHKTVRLATDLALSGELAKTAKEAGNAAVSAFKASQKAAAA